MKKKHVLSFVSLICLLNLSFLNTAESVELPTNKQMDEARAELDATKSYGPLATALVEAIKASPVGGGVGYEGPDTGGMTGKEHDEWVGNNFLRGFMANVQVSHDKSGKKDLDEKMLSDALIEGIDYAAQKDGKQIDASQKSLMKKELFSFFTTGTMHDEHGHKVMSASKERLCVYYYGNDRIFSCVNGSSLTDENGTIQVVFREGAMPVIKDKKFMCANMLHPFSVCSAVNDIFFQEDDDAEDRADVRETRQMVVDMCGKECLDAMLEQGPTIVEQGMFSQSTMSIEEAMRLFNCYTQTGSCRCKRQGTQGQEQILYHDDGKTVFAYITSNAVLNAARQAQIKLGSNGAPTTISNRDFYCAYALHPDGLEAAYFNGSPVANKAEQNKHHQLFRQNCGDEWYQALLKSYATGQRQTVMAQFEQYARYYNF